MSEDAALIIQGSESDFFKAMVNVIEERDRLIDELVKSQNEADGWRIAHGELSKLYAIERDQIIEKCEGIHSALESSLPKQDLSERQLGYEQGIEDYFQAIRAMKDEKP